MSKKLTYEFVKNSFEKEGYILLSKEYISSRTKLNYICPNGHKHNVLGNNWAQGARCPYCSKKIKLTIDKVKTSFEKEGYTLTTKHYANNKVKLNYICPKGHKNSVRWSDWIGGCRCPYCIGRGKPSLEHIRVSFEKESYTLLSDVYKNASTKLKFICPEGHEHSIRWYSWQEGYRCLLCAQEDRKLKLEEVKQSFEKEGYTLVSKNYINAHTKLKYVCPDGHTNSTVWCSWQQGTRCPTCYRLNNFGENHPNWRGGISFEPYCEAWKDKEYKQDIRDRDGNKCLNPYCDSPDNTDLTIHHIDYDKKNCKPSNLITVCRSCNSKANTDRSWHTEWYNLILNRRYGYGNRNYKHTKRFSN